MIRTLQLAGRPTDFPGITGSEGDQEEALQRQLFAGAAQATADYGRFLLSQQFTEASSTLQLPQPGGRMRR